MSNKFRIASAVGGIAVAIALIVPTLQRWEGHEARPYKDMIGVLTVCYGHTGPDIRPKDVYTPKECTTLLEKDIEKFATGVLKITPTIEDKPYVLASAISFSYNVGLENYRKSSTARNYNKGNYPLGCAYMLLYNKAGGKFVQGLQNRREDEFNICIKGAIE